jgi:hypothetical protein
MVAVCLISQLLLYLMKGIVSKSITSGYLFIFAPLRLSEGRSIPCTVMNY